MEWAYLVLHGSGRGALWHESWQGLKIQTILRRVPPFCREWHSSDMNRTDLITRNDFALFVRSAPLYPSLPDCLLNKTRANDSLALHSQKTDHYISKYPRLVWRGEKNAVISIDATEIISDIHFIKVLCMCLVTHEMFFGDDDDDDWCHW